MNIKLTKHAREKMRSRNVTFEQVVRLIAKPDITEPHEGKTRYTKDGLCAIVARERDDHVVITILLRDGNQWSDEDVATRGE